jgi:hypothetical protein
MVQSGFFGYRHGRWFVLAIFLFVGAMMWYGWRGARTPFHLLAILWTGTQSILLIKGVIEHGQ